MAATLEAGSAATGAPPVVAVVGPTATGKTALAVLLALRLGRAELVNADSRQVLRGLRIGTNTPTPDDLSGVPCHLLGITDPGKPFSVADWLGAARSCLAGLEQRSLRPVVVGGTGLYVRALMDGWELSGDPPDPGRRAWLSTAAATPEGLAELAEELRRRDPRGAAELDLRNPRRVVRALELVEKHGSLAARPAAGPSRAGIWIGVEAERGLHRAWIEERARAMVEGDLTAETREARERGVPARALEASGIGYKEALGMLDGRLTKSEAITEIVRRTVRYAKAQRTWFRAEPRVIWLCRESDHDLEDVADRALALSSAG